jgi:hypothetical protein
LIVAALEFFPVIGNVTDQIALRILEDALADMCAYTPIERGKFVKIVAVEPPRVEEASIHGRSHFDVALDANTKAKKARILSDGEQRALSIACFLAEVGRTLGNHGIIVDDPVSSLDHLRLRTVAQRLVQEAANGRQVIIFTHNLVFFQEVRNAASRRAAQVPVTTHLIAKKEDGSFGLIYEGDVPWEAQRGRDRVPTLRHRIAAIPDGLDEQSPRYRQYATDFYASLRETWERLVEELLFCGVVERYAPGVKNLSLKGVSVSDDDYRKVHAAISRASELSGHDAAAGRQIAMPDKPAMVADLQTLIEYERELRRRSDQLARRRRVLEQAPEGRML